MVAASEQIDAAVESQLSLWKEMTAGRIKGKRYPDGQFYALAEGENLLRNPPARRALVEALTLRMQGGSKGDFDFLELALPAR